MPYIGKSPSAGVRQRYQYTATAGQTTFSGTDLGNLTLNYVDNNFVDVFQNGVLLKGGGTDYTATSGTSVVLATGASVSDVIEIIVYDVFSVGNFFNRTDSDSRYVNVDGDTMTGNLTLGTTSSSQPILQFLSSTSGANTIHFGDGSSSDAYRGYVNYNHSTDALELATSGTVGLKIDANGHITKPLQSAFCVTKSSDQTNIAVASEVTVTFDTERFDQNADFASNTFTAPVTGKYQLSATVGLITIDDASAYYYVNILTSNTTYRTIFDPDFGQDNAYFPIIVSAVADMDANDTAIIQVAQAGGTQQTGVQAGTYTRFSGCLLA